MTENTFSFYNDRMHDVVVALTTIKIGLVRKENIVPLRLFECNDGIRKIFSNSFVKNKFTANNIRYIKT